MTKLGQTLPDFTKHDQLWLNLTKFRQTLTKIDQTWTNLTKLDQKRANKTSLSESLAQLNFSLFSLPSYFWFNAQSYSVPCIILLIFYQKSSTTTTHSYTHSSSDSLLSDSSMSSTLLFFREARIPLSEESEPLLSSASLSLKIPDGPVLDYWMISAGPVI